VVKTSLNRKTLTLKLAPVTKKPAPVKAPKKPLIPNSSLKHVLVPSDALKFNMQGKK